MSLVLHMMNEHRGEDMTREDAVTWLGENFGRGRASAAYLVEREHSVQGLFERAFGRGEPGHDRGGQDRVGTDRGGGDPSFGGR